MITHEQHINVHLINPDINYVKTENCRFCARDRKIHYGGYADIKNTYGVTYEFNYYWLIQLRNTAILHNLPVNDKLYRLTKVKNTHNIISHKCKNGKQMCSICMFNDNKKYVKLKKCQHIFHQECLKEWTYYSDTCPLCRTNI